MSIFKRFLELVTGRRIRRPRVMVTGTAPISEADAGFILSSIALSKWADVEYYGPGAAEAEARRARRLGTMLAQPKDKKKDKAEEDEPRSAIGAIDHDICPD